MEKCAHIHTYTHVQTHTCTQTDRQNALSLFVESPFPVLLTLYLNQLDMKLLNIQLTLLKFPYCPHSALLNLIGQFDQHVAM